MYEAIQLNKYYTTTGSRGHIFTISFFFWTSLLERKGRHLLTCLSCVTFSLNHYCHLSAALLHSSLKTKLSIFLCTGSPPFILTKPFSYTNILKTHYLGDLNLTYSIKEKRLVQSILILQRAMSQNHH